MEMSMIEGAPSTLAMPDTLRLKTVAAVFRAGPEAGFMDYVLYRKRHGIH
jgi:hypothetical protein